MRRRRRDETSATAAWTRPEATYRADRRLAERGKTRAEARIEPIDRSIEFRLGRKKEARMIRKLSSDAFRLYSRKTDPKTGRRRNLGTFKSRAAAEKHEREVQYFKRH
jgi:hypothetical protein